MEKPAGAKAEMEDVGKPGTHASSSSLKKLQGCLHTEVPEREKNSIPKRGLHPETRADLCQIS